MAARGYPGAFFSVSVKWSLTAAAYFATMVPVLYGSVQVFYPEAIWRSAAPGNKEADHGKRIFKEKVPGRQARHPCGTDPGGEAEELVVL